jgi:hypothetical protein
MRALTFPLILLVSLLATAICCTGCDPACEGISQQLEFPVGVFPRSDTLHLGDTLTILSSFSNEVYDRKQGITHTIEGARFFPIIFLNNIDSANVTGGMLIDSNLIVENNYEYTISTSHDGETAMWTEYFYDGINYLLKINVVLKRRGLCFFRIGAYYGEDGLPCPHFTGSCGCPTWYFKLEDEANNNIEFIQKAPDPYLKKFKSPEYYNRVGGYCFYVTD